MRGRGRWSDPVHVRCSPGCLRCLHRAPGLHDVDRRARRVEPPPPARGSARSRWTGDSPAARRGGGTSNGSSGAASCFPGPRILTGVELGEPHWHAEATKRSRRRYVRQDPWLCHCLPDGDSSVSGPTMYRHRDPGEVLSSYLLEPRAAADSGRGPGDQHGYTAARNVLEWWHEEGGDAVTFGIDAHDPSTVAQHFRDTVRVGTRPRRQRYWTVHGEEKRFLLGAGAHRLSPALFAGLATTRSTSGRGQIDLSRRVWDWAPIVGEDQVSGPAGARYGTSTTLDYVSLTSRPSEMSGFRHSQRAATEALGEVQAEEFASLRSSMARPEPDATAVNDLRSAIGDLQPHLLVAGLQVELGRPLTPRQPEGHAARKPVPLPAQFVACARLGLRVRVPVLLQRHT